MHAHVMCVPTQKLVTLTAYNKEKVWKQLLDILQPRKDLGIKVRETIMCYYDLLLH